MKHKKSLLKINPVKRYSVAKYPSYSDPNPIDHPETLPYPFKEKLMNALMATGLAGSLAFMSASNGTQEIDKTAMTQQDSLINPFPFVMTGLPYQPPSYGTGLPSRIQAEEARRVIEEAFEKEGVELQKNYPVNKDGVKVTTNGYNEDLKIGYIWMDWDNLKRGDGIVTYRGKRFSETQDGDERQHHVLDRFSQRIAFPKNIINEFKNTKQNWKKKYGKQLEEIYSEGQPLSKQDSIQFQQIYLTYLVKNSIKHTNQKELAAFGNQVLEIINDQEKLKQTLRFFDMETVLHMLHYGNRLDKDVIAQILMDKVNQSSQQEWNKLLVRLSNIISFYSQRNTPLEIKNKIEKSFDLPKKERADTWDEILEVYDFKTISIKEVKGLEYYADNLKQDFIAPISQYDNRHAYSIWGREMDAETLKKIEETETREEKWKIRQEHNQKSINKAHSQKLSELENQVRQYIRWAKSQQGF